ncbi:UDP-N-acetylenolpyruvoylglucosamine reductase [Pseudomonas coronafaciens pv. porri]|uniref:UDP-N-acetylenolpyruvoylglucosamine reductase n=1 Tax=Pseudomonas coronafaciens pv. porri TaxID=83964 RepID=A0ABR5JKM0_9PSED|nr:MULTISPECIES: UDP-N-acetylmuramate dehydrogenase [Pseudomonas syringae group]KOP52742.1 UDP-N-acetylenolpyruvoylglucosamine reductase [Pseudomonas coronafaciens pv. porri]KOP55166.1 UDP-N-acetylenolpyruvoylglucosamine reductase [Pseudomonas coronafaciens pv. porri]KPB50712.1 UDP-N-acetylenolpyruvoylglucosamine reductase [Pseudomonas coronafaciens pv. oryzae]KPY03144.1 UDP-N-acetylenolpyruvoylglucosamine reductase [Pseudomonas coronafaciens pv. oryzae]KPY15468.1 UDP-N-acetylenolpyruvoylgluco
MTLQVHSDVSLKPFNTFGVNVQAQLFAEAHSDDDVLEALAYSAEHDVPLLVIGGGSNLLLSSNVQALVLRMTSRGIRIVREDCAESIVEAEAGEPWHPFVQSCLELGLAGLENLSLIPGTVGAAPMQNIGAYGVEIKDVFHSLTALDRETGELREFSLDDCAFGYRDSVFKHQVARWLILRVRFRLTRDARLHLEYGPVRQRLNELGIEKPTPFDVSRAICAIRSEKLPDPAVLGNAGSFFKNPVISAELYIRLQSEHLGVVGYPQPDGRVKLAAGWLIEQAGWKGFREGDAGVHTLQSLVLVNYGQASGLQLLNLARRIQADIAERFGVELEMEPNLY